MIFENFDTKKKELMPFSNNNFIFGDVIYFDKQNNRIKICVNSVYRIVIYVKEIDNFFCEEKVTIDMVTGEFI